MVFARCSVFGRCIGETLGVSAASGDLDGGTPMRLSLPSSRIHDVVSRSDVKVRPRAPARTPRRDGEHPYAALGPDRFRGVNSHVGRWFGTAR